MPRIATRDGSSESVLERMVMKRLNGVTMILILANQKEVMEADSTYNNVRCEAGESWMCHQPVVNDKRS